VRRRQRGGSVEASRSGNPELRTMTWSTRAFSAVRQPGQLTRRLQHRAGCAGGVAAPPSATWLVASPMQDDLAASRRRRRRRSRGAASCWWLRGLGWYAATASFSSAESERGCRRSPRRWRRGRLVHRIDLAGDVLGRIARSGPPAPFTSLATTAKPLPAAPARAASIVAFSASKLVCAGDVAEINPTTSETRAAP
jgi:hypothetical protein